MAKWDELTGFATIADCMASDGSSACVVFPEMPEFEHRDDTGVGREESE
jgi:hypothetical protein